MERITPLLTEEEIIIAEAFGGSDALENPNLNPPNTPYCDDPHHIKRTIKNGSGNHKKHLDRVRNNGNSNNANIIIEKSQNINNQKDVCISRRRKARKPR